MHVDQKIILLLFLSCILFCRATWAEQEVLAIQSVRIPPYEEVIQGFATVCHAKMTRIFTSDAAGADFIAQIRMRKPRLILAIGMDALSKVKHIKHLPIVYLMVFDPKSILSSEKNITGISMNIPQDRQMAILSKALTGIKNVGLVYDPIKTGDLAEQARDASEKLGINLISSEVNRASEVPLRIMEMEGKIEVLWMLPDLTVVTPASVEYMILFSIEHRIPILTFAEKYVELGALMSISIDPMDVGRQAGQMANAIFSGKPVQDEDPRKATISINPKLAKKLGITIDEQVFMKAKIVE